MLDTLLIVEILVSIAVSNEDKGVAFYFGFKIHQFIGNGYYSIQNNDKHLLELQVSMSYWWKMYDIDRYGNAIY
jgi:hypothetical protein